MRGVEEGLSVVCGVVRESFSDERTLSRDLNSSIEWIPGGRAFRKRGPRVQRNSSGAPVTGCLEPRPFWENNLSPREMLRHIARCKGPVLTVCPCGSQNVRCVHSHDLGWLLK